MQRRRYSLSKKLYYIYLLAVYLTTLSVSRLTQRRMFVLDEMWEESGYEFKARGVCRHLPEGNEMNHQNPQSG